MDPRVPPPKAPNMTRAKADRHVCDDRCACPVHDTPLFYSPSADDHACQDISCVHGHGLKVDTSAWEPRNSLHPRSRT